jgi:general stress protein 26
MQHSQQNDSAQRLKEIVKDIKFAMLTTRSAGEGGLRSRPMTLQEASFDGGFWFFTGKNSAIASDIEKDHHVNLAFSNPKTSSYVSVTGEAFLLDDKERAKELWNPIYKAWFPQGVDDPNLVLLHVHVAQADYWETPDSKVVQMLGFAKAILTGKKAKGIGERGHVDGHDLKVG